MTATVQTQPPRQQARWAGVVALGIGIFALVMSEFLPASLLPRIAEDLGVTEGAAGQSVTVTAAAAALAALFVPVLLPRADRRLVVTGLSALAVASNVLVILAPNLGVLVAARILLGIGLGGFWAMSIAVTARLVPAERLGRALTIVNAGVSIATVGAVPLGAWLGDVWGWRGVFVLAAVAITAALVLQWGTLPQLPVLSQHGGGLRALGASLRSLVAVAGLAAILLIAGGHFLAFTYIRPIISELSDVSTDTTALILLVYGVAILVGTIFAGQIADRALRAGLLVFPIVCGAGMFLMLVIGGSFAGLMIAAAVWGIGMGGVPTSMQAWGARVSPARLEQISGLITVMFNVAIAVGAVVGGVLVDGVSATALLAVGGAAAVVSGLWIGTLRLPGKTDAAV